MGAIKVVMKPQKHVMSSWGVDALMPETFVYCKCMLFVAEIRIEVAKRPLFLFSEATPSRAKLPKAILPKRSRSDPLRRAKPSTFTA